MSHMVALQHTLDLGSYAIPSYRAHSLHMLGSSTTQRPSGPGIVPDTSGPREVLGIGARYFYSQVVRLALKRGAKRAHLLKIKA